MPTLLLALLLLASGPPATQQSLRLDFSLQGEDLPQYFIARTFLDLADSFATEDPERLATFLARFNVLPDGPPGRVLLREAAVVRAQLSTPWRRPEDFQSPAQYEGYQRERALTDARLVGECFGRFLLELDQVGRSPRGFQDILREELGPSVSLAYSDPADLPFFHAQEKAFQAGLVAVGRRQHQPRPRPAAIP